MEAQPNGSVIVEPPQVPVASSSPGCLTYLLFVATLIWIVMVTAVIHVAGWYTDQVLLIEEIPISWFVWPLISLGHGILLALPVVPLAIWTRAPRFRATYRTWAIAIAFIMVLALARVFAMTQTLPAAVAQIVLGLACVIGVLIWMWIRGHRLSARLDVLAPALALAPIMVAPSLLWGALGSPLDAVLNLLAGLTLGLFAGIVLSVFLFGPISEHSSRPGRDMAFGGVAAGAALVILGGGFGFGGSQLLLLICLPFLGLAVAGAARWSGAAVAERAWLPIAALVGLTAAAPLMFVDPDELTLLLEGREIMAWALQAAGVSLVLALLVGLALWIFSKRISGAPRPALSLGGVAVTWIAGALLYFFAGQPGFYGEQLFVILRDQADVRPAYTIPDRNERLRYVYTTLTQHANATQSNLRAALDRGRIGYRSYYLVNGMEVNGGPLVRAYLSRQPEVDRILDSPHLRPLPEPVPVSVGHDPAPTELQWNITSIGADRVWKELGVTGQGIVVGQSDSGVQGDHPALRDGYRGRDRQNDYNWLDPWNHTRMPTDINGHGTHTLGSIVGRGGIGVAPGAEWFGCVNLARNIGDPAWYLNCMQFMLAPYPQNGDPFKDGDPTQAAHVINDSWGCPPLEGCDAKSLEPAVAALRAAGIFVVASAGNEGPRCGSVSDPIAIYSEAFSVGAVDRFGEVAFFSSRGPVTVDGSGRIKPDILAPGVDVMSSLPGDKYGSNSGTSMAGPHVVGVVALMWSAQPRLIGDIDRTQQILEQTAQPYTGTQDPCSTGGRPNNTSGYGLVDAYAAVKAALAEK
jgi:subtilisin family serine protease